MSDILDAALAWFASGACVLPAAADGTKRPAIEWRRYQHERPDEAQLRDWFATGEHCGMGVVCGQVSGALQMTELERRAMDAGLLEKISELCVAIGLGPVWTRVVKGYAEASPSGGLHLFWRIKDGKVPGNTKLARRPATTEELAASPDRFKVLIETRGEAGWVVTAPSNGATHPTGQPWSVLHGSPLTIATITATEHEQIMAVMRDFDQMPRAAAAAQPSDATQPQHQAADGSRPGDDFNERASWDDILIGWRKLYVHGGTTYWQRPGKNDPGPSATTGHATDADRLYVFSTSTEFEAETPYSKFGAYALLNHGGDHAAAASELRRQGYGAPLDDSAAAREQAETIAALIGDARLESFVSGQYAVADTALQKTPAMTTALDESASEQDVADWIVAHYRDQLFYVQAQKRFYYHNGVLWEPQPDTGMQWQIVRAGCEAVPGKRQRWGSQSVNANVKGLLERHPGMWVCRDELDPHTHLLNVPAGVIDLRTGQLSAHDPALMCTRVTRYTPGGYSDRFERFLAETFPAGQQLIDYVQTILGYCLYGHNCEEVFIIGHGVTGQNGKSALIEPVMHVLGDYADKGKSDWLMARRNGAHDSEITSLEGLRFAYFSEVNEGKLDEQRIKELSGGERIRYRQLYQSRYDSFGPEFTMMILLNDAPRIGQGGDSLWRRVRTIPFLHHIPDAERDVSLKTQFKQPEAGAAILAWLVAGAANYHRNGLGSSPEVDEANAEFRREVAGHLYDYVDQRLIIGGGEAVQLPKTTLYQDYQHWCYANGIQPTSANWLSKRLIDSFGLHDGRTTTQRFWYGVCLAGDDR